MFYEYKGRKGWTWGQAKKTKKGEKNKPQKSSRSRKENKLRKPSEISIQKDLQGPQAGTYEVTIDNKFFATTTLTCSESIIREWIREVRAINGKRYIPYLWVSPLSAAGNTMHSTIQKVRRFLFLIHILVKLFVVFIVSHDLLF